MKGCKYYSATDSYCPRTGKFNTNAIACNLNCSGHKPKGKFNQSEMAKHYKKDPSTITRWKKSQPEIYKAMKYYYEKEVMDHIKEKV